MENLVSMDMVVSIVGGGVITLLSQLLKGPFKNLNSRYVVMGVSILSGIAYYMFNTYLPEEFKQNVINFAYGSLSSAVFIYSFIMNKDSKK
jgi:uncharacterized membrane protein YjjP (DUF1212 family)